MAGTKCGMKRRGAASGEKGRKEGRENGILKRVCRAQYGVMQFRSANSFIAIAAISPPLLMGSLFDRFSTAGRRNSRVARRSASALSGDVRFLDNRRSADRSLRCNFRFEILYIDFN